MRMNFGLTAVGFSPETQRTRSVFRSLIASAAMGTVMALLLSGHTLAQENSVGAVYTSTNETDGNSVLIFSRAADGTLTSAGSISTQGKGNGQVGPPLASQGSVTLSPDNKWLLVVNAGSDDVTVFSVTPDGLEFRSITNSGGSTPVSVTMLGNVVYVLNQGTPSLVGFRMDAQGALTAILGAVQTLPDAKVPVQVAFAPKGGLLVVTDIVANLIYTLEVNNDVAGTPTSHGVGGLNPFGFAFDGRNHLLVTEGNLFDPGASSVSSYNVTAGGALDTITGSATTMHRFACWVSVTNDGRFAYVSDTGSGVISAFSVGPDGRLTLLNSIGIGVSATVTGAPIDNGLSHDSRFLFSLVTGRTESIVGWQTNLGDGSLTLAAAVTTGIPRSAIGIAVR